MILIVIVVSLSFFNCSNSEDDNIDPYTAFERMPNTLLGTWTYKSSGAENIDAILTFSETSPNNPIMNIKINGYTYSGKPYYPTSGGDGSLYFKLSNKSTYSKLSYYENPFLNNSMRFKIENVESYVIDKMFQKKP